MLAIVLMSIPLGGCPELGKPGGELPPVPADIEACFREAIGVNVPVRKLTRAEVEALWKVDRVQIVVTRKCGFRFIAWYDDLRAGWK